MNITLQAITPDDKNAIVVLFNYYIENSFAAYPEEKVPEEFFDFLMRICQGYPTVSIKNSENEVLGFGMLRPYSPLSTFSQTAEITYFLKPEVTGQGIGKMVMEYLCQKGQERGITCILASVSSKNDGSLRFHEKNGFQECGRFQKIGMKHGQNFDVVYFQKFLSPENTRSESQDSLPNS